MNIKEKLATIQQELKVPKTKPNKFGGYKYRNVDMILEAIKPLLKDQKCILTLNDEVVEVGGRVYVKAMAVLEESDGEGGIGVSGWAREQLERKKSDDSQLTGAASTYARKRALEGLLLLDDSGDVQDPDSYEEDPEEELDKQEAEELQQEEEEAPVERKPRSRRKKKAETPDFMNIPEGVDEEVPFDAVKEQQELSEEELEEHIGKVFGGPYDPETGLPTMEDEEDEKLTKDTCFKVLQADGKYNYIKLHAGDEIPEGAVEITEEEFKEGVTRIAQGKEEPEQKPMTRRARKRRNS